MTDSVTVVEPGGSIVVTQQGVNSLVVYDGSLLGEPGTLAESSDVNLTGLEDGDLISFSASIGKWLATRRSTLVDGGNF